MNEINADVTQHVLDLISKKYGSIRQFAMAIRVPYSTIKSGLKAGIEGMAVETVIKMCDGLDISVDDLKHIGNDNFRLSEFHKKYAIPIQNIYQIPVIGRVSAGMGGIAQIDPQGYEIATDLKNPDEYVYLTVRGDSMYPDIKDGDLALVHIQSVVDSGELAVVIVNGEEGVIKKVQYHENAVSLVSFNPEYPPRIIMGESLHEFQIFGKVVETKRKY